jgi:hypothetical protein
VLFLNWDDWGDFYDHVHPPGIDENGFIGIRVPGLAATGPAGREVFGEGRLLHFRPARGRRSHRLVA